MSDVVRPVSLGGCLAAGRRHLGALRQRRPTPLELGVFAEFPLIILAVVVWVVGVRRGWGMLDFEAMRNAGVAVLHGRSPYPTAESDVLLQSKQLVYPAIVAYLFVPFALLPYAIAAGVWFFVLIGCLFASLRFLGVRDARCYGVVMMWYPTTACLIFGALGPILTLMIAVAWRYRTRMAVIAPVAAVAIVLKLFLWPVGIWLLATRRLRTSALTLFLALIAFLVPFAPLGWRALRSYPHLLRVLDHTFGPITYTTQTMLARFGAPPHLRGAVILFLAIGLIVATLALGMKHHEVTSLIIAVAASLLLTPIVWWHYYVLLLIPLALAVPRLSPIWFLPVLYWLPVDWIPGDSSDARTVLNFIVTCVVSLVTIRAAHTPAGRPGAEQKRLTADRGEIAHVHVSPAHGR